MGDQYGQPYANGYEMQPMGTQPGAMQQQPYPGPGQPAVYMAPQQGYQPQPGYQPQYVATANGQMMQQPPGQPQHTVVQMNPPQGSSFEQKQKSDYKDDKEGRAEADEDAECCCCCKIPKRKKPTIYKKKKGCSMGCIKCCNYIYTYTPLRLLEGVMRMLWHSFWAVMLFAFSFFCCWRVKCMNGLSSNHWSLFIWYLSDIFCLHCNVKGWPIRRLQYFMAPLIFNCMCLKKICGPTWRRCCPGPKTYVHVDSDDSDDEDWDLDADCGCENGCCDGCDCGECCSGDGGDSGCCDGGCDCDCDCDCD